MEAELINNNSTGVRMHALTSSESTRDELSEHRITAEISTSTSETSISKSPSR